MNYFILLQILILPYMQKICLNDRDHFGHLIVRRAGVEELYRSTAKESRDFIIYEKEKIYIAIERYKNLEFLEE